MSAAAFRFAYTRKENVEVEEETPACSVAEWGARVELAALFRLLAHYRMDDLANGG